ncbi:PQQ-dependent sugar dehydrogenase [Fictibacillus iocasae]|uniref:PQQ-dependent sugar dehydrogenase n=1 Tax=Fictibacillus iocasae TaxID=2715437 RepID=A0ABW2NS69_9BACL
MIKRFYAACAAIIFASGCYSGETDAVKEKRKADTITKNLSAPWNIARSDKEWWITERTGKIVLMNKVDYKKTSFTPSLAKPLHVSGEGGFLGFELHPDYPKTAKGYAYYTYIEEGTAYNKIAELTREKGKWIETKALLGKIPAGTIHNGGRIKFGPDGMLYATVGDAGIPENAQNQASLAGKIIRLKSDGTFPQDNPFSGSPVYSMGHRNPQGLAWDSEGRMFASEHGQSHHDEINIIEPGANYGWPLVEGDDTHKGYTPPFLHSGDETWAPSGMAVLGGNLYIACLRGEQILKVNIKQKKAAPFLTGMGRMRDILLEEVTLLALTNNTDGRGVPKEGDDRLLQIEVR